MWIGTVIERPHLVGALEAQCWCKPAVVECTCPGDHGPVYGHSCVEVRPDNQPRAASFSEPTWYIYCRRG